MFEESLERKYFHEFKNLLDSDKKKKDTYCEYMTRLNLASTPYIVNFANQIISNVQWTVTSKTGISLTSIASVSGLKSRSLHSSGTRVASLSNPFVNNGLLNRDIEIMANNGDLNTQTAAVPGIGTRESMLLGMSFP